MIHTGNFKRVEIYHNTRGETPEAIKSKTGCDTIVNGMLFNPDGSFCLKARIKGKTVANEDGIFYGYGWSGNALPVITHSDKMSSYDNYITSIHIEPTVKRGRTAVSFYNGKYTVLSVADGNNAMTVPQVEETMRKYNSQFLILDGGGSSYLDCPSGKVDTTYQRKTGNKMYLLIWEDDSKRKYKVCLDPGHGIKEPNQSPDGRYLEYKMAWALSNKIKELLESTERFDVILTKKSEGETPSLAARAKIANDADADIFWSTHSNAVAGGWNDTIHGITAWIYALGGQREKLARHFLEQCKELGIELFGSELYTAKFAVLAQTYMPAILVENYFHTCRTDVDKLLQDKEIETLAYAAARAICEYFNLSEDLIPLTEEEVEHEHEVWTDILYRVQTGAFANEANAEAMAKALKSHGFDTIIKEERQ